MSSKKQKTVVAPHLARGKESKSYDKPWWGTNKRDRGKASCAASDRWFNQHSGRFTEYNLLTQQYTQSAAGNNPGDYESAGRHSEYLRFNLIRSVVDTVVARYAKEQPRPVFTTERGRYRHRRYARQLNKAVMGLYEQVKMYTKTPLSFRNACLYGVGFTKVAMHPKTLDIEVECVHPGEVAWDVVDAFRGTPHELAHRVAVPRHVVQALFPERKSELQSADSVVTGSVGGSATISDLIYLTEMYKLPSYTGAGDGVRALVCGDVELQWEEWDFDFFPLIPIHYEHSFRGFSGEGLGSLLMGLHYSVNEDMAAAEESVKRASKVRVWVKDGADVSVTQLEEDENAAIYTYGSEKPSFEVAQALGSDAVDFTRWKIGAGYDLSGVSQLSASGQKPVGLDAGVALREQQDIESLRFMRQQRAYEQHILDITEAVVHYMHKYWAGKGKEIKSPGRNFIERIDFDAIDLERDQYEIRVTPASMLPLTIGAKMQTVREMLDLGFLSPSQAMSLLNVTDVEAETSLKTAAQDDIDATIDGMLFDEPTAEELKGTQVSRLLKTAESIKDADLREAEIERVKARVVYTPPGPEQANQENITRVHATLLREKHNDVPEARLELLREWLLEAKELMMQAAMEGQANAIGVGPSGTPGLQGAPQQPMQGLPQGGPLPGGMNV